MKYLQKYTFSKRNKFTKILIEQDITIHKCKLSTNVNTDVNFFFYT